MANALHQQRLLESGQRRDLVGAAAAPPPALAAPPQKSGKKKRPSLPAEHSLSRLAQITMELRALGQELGPRNLRALAGEVATHLEREAARGEGGHG